MSTFVIDLTQFAKNADPAIVVRKTALDVFKSVIMRTPVLSGRARGNWQTTVHQPADGVIERLDKSGTKAIAEATNVITKQKDGESIFMANNLPYILALEHGHSKQASSGMVSQAIPEFPYLVKKATK